MTLQEAQQALLEGKAIKGPHFTDEEYIWTNPRTGKMEFEDGVNFSWHDFWQWRKQEDYQDGWEIVTIFSNQPEPLKFTDPHRFEKEKEHIETLSLRGDRIRGGWAPYVRSEEKIHRNNLCPCGSGSKYKKCHGLK